MKFWSVQRSRWALQGKKSQSSIDLSQNIPLMGIRRQGDVAGVLSKLG